jgi:hypothetical protein
MNKLVGFLIMVLIGSIGGGTGIYKIVDSFKTSKEEKQIKALSGQVKVDSVYKVQLINEIGVLTDSLSMANFKLKFANKSTGDFQRLILAYRNQLNDCAEHTESIINASAGLKIDSVFNPEEKKKWWQRKK